MIDEKKLIEELNRQKYILTFEDSNPIDEGFNCGIDKAIQLVESQPKVGEWIPVEERLPKNYENVLVSCQNGEVDYGFHDKDSGWVLDYVDDKAYPVLAWQPLPEPYEVKENERP